MMPNADGMNQVQVQQHYEFTDQSGNALQTITNIEQNQTIASSNHTPSYQDDEDDDAPMYVNAKQFDRIMKRRAARAKLENEGRIPRVRKVKYNYSFQLINHLKP
jgi:hypothetical protein